MKLTIINIIRNKKVLLRKRKRHTARHVSSAPRYAGGGGYPVPGLGGYPVPGPGGGYMVPGLRGVPGPRSGGGTPSHVWGVPHPMSWGGHPIPCWGGTPSHVWGGNPHTWDGVPPPSQTLDQWVPPPTIQTWMGYPLPPPEMLTDRHVWKQYLPVILRMRAVIIGKSHELHFN